MKSFSTALLAALCALTAQDAVNAFQPATPRVHACTQAGTSVTAAISPLFSVATNGVATTDEDKSQQIRREGGPLAFKTKYGALNPYAIYYGSLSILLGIPWFFALKFYGLLARVTQKRFDRLAFIPTLLNHLWGVTLLRLTRSYPVVENMDILRDFYKEYVWSSLIWMQHRAWDVSYVPLLTLSSPPSLSLYLVQLLFACFPRQNTETALPCLSPITILGWIFLSWVPRLAGVITSLWPRRNSKRYPF
jgi:hypothetical protein